MKTQYSVLRYRIDFYFDDYKLAIEVDEFGHSDRDKTIKQKAKQNRKRAWLKYFESCKWNTQTGKRINNRQDRQESLIDKI